jgi:hypothetical protein
VDQGLSAQTWDPLPYLNNKNDSTGVYPSGVSGHVYAVVYDGNDIIYVGGDFKSAGGITANNIARYVVGNQQWFALTDSTIKLNGVNGIVYALAYDANSQLLYVGGNYTSAVGLNTKNIAQWDANSQIWVEINSNGFSGPIYALDWDSIYNRLYAGGDFISADFIIASNIAFWDTSNWFALPGSSGGEGTNDIVRAIKMASFNQLVYVGGDFTAVEFLGGTPKPASRIATWNPSSNKWEDIGGANSYVLALEECNSEMIVGGNFTIVNILSPVSANYIARVDGSNNWNILGSNDVNDIVRCITYDNINPVGLLYFGGDFTAMTTVVAGVFTSVKYISSADPLSSYAFDALPATGYGTNSNGTNGPVYSVDKGRVGFPIIVTGGLFTKTYYDSILSTQNIQYGNNVVYWDYNFTFNLGWNIMNSRIPDLNGIVKALVYTATDIYAGGEFQNVSTTQALHFVRWNIADELWYPIISNSENGVNDTVNALTIDAQHIYLGGKFTIGGGKLLNYIGKCDISNSLFGQFNFITDIGFNDQVTSLFVNAADTLVIGGIFTQTETGLLTNIYRVAKASIVTDIISAIRNLSGTHSGFDGPVFAVYNINPYIYFGGSFSISASLGDLTLNNCAYYDASALSGLVILIPVGTGAFIDTETLTISSSITLPLKYKLANLICSDFDLNTWIVAFRSIGVTF